MAFYTSSLNVCDVRELPVGENPRDYSDFLIPISEQEYYEIRRSCRFYDRYNTLRKKGPNDQNKLDHREDKIVGVGELGEEPGKTVKG